MPSPLVSWMFFAATIRSIAAQTTGKLGNAAVINNNPVGASYVANIPSDAFWTDAYPNGGNIEGSIQAVSSPDGTGVLFQLNVSNLPSEGGPFLYHLHAEPVPADGNCTSTLAHLDPYERGETPACDASQPDTCQVGDLAGKHGDITSNPFNATYTDMFASTLPGIGAFFANRSIVFHFSNATRITCANFTAIDDAAGSPSSTSSNSTTITSSSSTMSSTSTSTSTSTTDESTTTTSTTSSSSSASTTTGNPNGGDSSSNSTATPSPTVVAVNAAVGNFPPTLLGFGLAVLVFVMQ